MHKSPFFQLLHHETAPVGSLGRGAHHSIVRAVIPAWSYADEHRKDEINLCGVKRLPLVLCDFVVIWDEDHDERIWPVLERIWADGLLAPVRYIGERKGTIHVILDEEMLYQLVLAGHYKQMLERSIMADEGDDWHVSIEEGWDHSGGIIQAEHKRVVQYLQGIATPWRLGCKPYEHKIWPKPD